MNQQLWVIPGTMEQGRGGGHSRTHSALRATFLLIGHLHGLHQWLKICKTCPYFPPGDSAFVVEA